MPIPEVVEHVEFNREELQLLLRVLLTFNSVVKYSIFGGTIASDAVDALISKLTKAS